MEAMETTAPTHDEARQRRLLTRRRLGSHGFGTLCFHRTGVFCLRHQRCPSVFAVYGRERRERMIIHGEGETAETV